ncbi:hypothetical protein QW060_00555 [Myroides ceti]|uniref:Uncharacterized protein n=1 Tax=Paenimyroides ceti TaxID=395087 RepID=A0ABT8CPP7_9FLAO|nr:hypothetical protein [Paenimyroides ceti]MDN3705623.1 hypothetical protein [Paenimyroides ceti]
MILQTLDYRHYILIGIYIVVLAVYFLWLYKKRDRKRIKKSLINMAVVFGILLVGILFMDLFGTIAVQ